MGGAAGDRTRNITGIVNNLRLAVDALLTGVFYSPGTASLAAAGTTLTVANLGLDASRGIPTGPTNSPRAWGALAGAYLGQPATV